MAGLFVLRVVVVMKQVVAAAVDAAVVAGFDQSFLTAGGVASAICCVDGVAIARDVHDDFGVYGSSALCQEAFDRVGPLLGDGWPVT